MDIPDEPIPVNDANFWVHTHQFLERHKMGRPLDTQQFQTMIACMELEPEYIFKFNPRCGYWQWYFCGGQQRIPNCANRVRPDQILNMGKSCTDPKSRLGKRCIAWGELWWELSKKYRPWDWE